jgi:hypothetical protein
VSETKKFGELIDTLDNLVHAMELALPPAVHVKHLKSNLAELVKDFKATYVDATGENPWEGQPL